jgi:hypothetical protein
MSNSVDKGFGINYWRLSYRRRFLRDLWAAGICIPLLAVLLLWRNGWDNFAALWPAGVGALICAVQAAYNYSRWQAEQRTGNAA